MKNHVRFGLYGCNLYRTKDLMDAAAKCDDYNISIAACFDIVSEKVDEMAKMHDAKACYDLESFLKADYDVALISLPPFLHPDAFAACAEAGRDIYLEKPVCVDDAGEKKIVEAAKKYKPLCYVGISYKYVAPFKKALELRHRPDAGRLLAFYFHGFGPGKGIIPEGQENNWRYRFEKSAGDLNNHGSHYFHYIRLMCGEPLSVTATSYTSPDYQPSFDEEELNACFRLKEGFAVLQKSRRAHQSNVIGHCNLENMGISFNWANHSEVKVYKERPRAAEEIYEFDESYSREVPKEDDRNVLQMVDFLNAYTNGEPMPITISDGIQSFRILQAVRESYKNRCEVTIPAPEVF